MHKMVKGAEAAMETQMKIVCGNIEPQKILLANAICNPRNIGQSAAVASNVRQRWKRVEQQRIKFR